MFIITKEFINCVTENGTVGITKRKYVEIDDEFQQVGTEESGVFTPETAEKAYEFAPSVKAVLEAIWNTPAIKELWEVKTDD